MAKVAKTEEMKPFMFERSFDEFDPDKKKAAANAEPPPEDIPEPEPEISFSEEEMNTQKQQSYMDGHADGFREGHAEAMDTLERQLNELLERLAPMVSKLGEEQRKANERAQANMARMVQELMNKLMPIYVKNHGAEEAMAVVTECLAELQDPGRLSIHLSEETADLLGDRLNKAAERAGFQGVIRLRPEEDMGASDVRVDWGAGGAERRYETIKTDVDAAIDRAVARALETIEADSEPETPLVMDDENNTDDQDTLETDAPDAGDVQDKE